MRTVFLMAAILVVGCSPINRKLGVSDNWVGEEFLEDVIQAKTGWDVNLSDTPEQ
ncbi:MAG: hypothetical protein Q8O94_03595 [bacterium]|nr:hypothetical protein [bacterium]